MIHDEPEHDMNRNDILNEHLGLIYYSIIFEHLI